MVGIEINFTTVFQTFWQIVEWTEKGIAPGMLIIAPTFNYGDRIGQDDSLQVDAADKGIFLDASNTLWDNNLNQIITVGKLPAFDDGVVSKNGLLQLT